MSSTRFEHQTLAQRVVFGAGRVPEDGIDQVADQVTVPPGNPRPVSGEDVRALLHRAWAGLDPVTDPASDTTSTSRRSA